MAEILAILGGGVAATQIFQYSLLLISGTSALSQQMRDSSDAIQFRDTQSLCVFEIISSLRTDPSFQDPVTASLLEQCFQYMTEVRSLMERLRNGNRTKGLAKFRTKLLLVQKESVINRKIETVIGILNMLASRKTLLDHNHTSGICGIQMPAASYASASSPTPNWTMTSLHNRDDLFVISCQSNMGVTLFLEGQFGEAERVHRHVYNERARILGHNHHETIKSMANMAMTVNELGRYTEAEGMYTKALSMFQSVVGVEHADTIKTYTNLATNLYDQGKFEAADKAINAALPLIQGQHGWYHEDYLEALEFCAVVLDALKLYSAALEISRWAYDQRRLTLGEWHQTTLRVHHHLQCLIADCDEERAVRALVVVAE